MARARNIKPGFFTNEELAKCSPMARLLFIGLWTICDREGRLEDRPARIGAQVMPFDAHDVQALLDELQAARFIVRYSVKGQSLILIPNFNKHQKIHHKEAASTLPPPSTRLGRGRTPNQPPTSRPELLNDECLNASCLNDELLKPPTPLEGEGEFDGFWHAFPPGRREKRAKAKRAWGTALSRVSLSRGLSRTDAAAWLKSRAVDYARSPQGRSAFVKGPLPWLNGGCWDDDPAAWSRGDDVSPRAPPAARKLPTAAELILAQESQR